MNIQNIETFKGDSFSRSISFADSTGTAINITGYTLYLTVKASKSDTDAQAILSATVLPAQLSDPTHGIGVISVTATAMAAITAGNYYYDIKYKKGDGTVFTALSGNFDINETVTLRASA